MAMFKVEVESIRDPKWARSDRTVISCFAKFKHLREEVLFYANALDCEPHGRDIWKRCVDGEFGEVKDNEGMEAGFQEISNIETDLTKLIEKHNEENKNKSGIALVIIWSAKLDETLASVITYTGTKKLTFNDRINKAFKQGVIDEATKDKLHCVRRIRNQYAHDWDVTMDGCPSIIEDFRFLYEEDHKNYFEFVEDLGFLAQMIYVGTCLKIVLELNAKISL